MRVEGMGGSLNGDYATQEAVADATGGRAFYSDNDVASAMEDATEQGGNFYTLTYSPPDRSDDEKCHSIRVKLNKGNYQLSYRRSYCPVSYTHLTAYELIERRFGRGLRSLTAGLFLICLLYTSTGVCRAHG